jgi:hypothetical protein
LRAGGEPLASAGLNTTPDNVIDQQQQYVGLDVSLETTALPAFAREGRSLASRRVVAGIYAGRRRWRITKSLTLAT